MSATPSQSGPIGNVLSAMIIAGGSAGVNNLLVALGYRTQRTPEAVAPKPPTDEAWLSVKIVRQTSVGPVIVFIGGSLAPPISLLLRFQALVRVPGAAPAPPGLPVVGIIRNDASRWRYFLADPSRFHRMAAMRSTRTRWSRSASRDMMRATVPCRRSGVPVTR